MAYVYNTLPGGPASGAVRALQVGAATHTDPSGVVSSYSQSGKSITINLDDVSSGTVTTAAAWVWDYRTLFGETVTGQPDGQCMEWVIDITTLPASGSNIFVAFGFLDDGVLDGSNGVGALGLVNNSGTSLSTYRMTNAASAVGLSLSSGSRVYATVNGAVAFWSQALGYGLADSGAVSSGLDAATLSGAERNFSDTHFVLMAGRTGVSGNGADSIVVEVGCNALPPIQRTNYAIVC